MSVVHGNLSRRGADGTSHEPLVIETRPSNTDPDPLSELEQEIARKERLLTEGIHQLQQQVSELTGELNATRAEVVALRAENERLRHGALGAAMHTQRPPETGEPSLLSKAMR